MVERVFVYGTLLETTVQKSVIGREVFGEPDVLSGFSVSSIDIGGDCYPMIFPTEKGKVEGLVIELDEAELYRVDQYEGKEYRRAKVKLVGGIEAWVYKHPTK